MRNSAPRSVRQNDRQAFDHGPRYALEIRNVTIAAIEGGVPPLVEAREIIAAFHAMIRKKTYVELEP